MPQLREIVRGKANEIEQWLQDAVGDMADALDFVDSKWEKKIKEAKRNGCQDIKGWLADEYYNDVDSIQDMLGDRIHDASTQIRALGFELKHDDIFISICEEIKEGGHGALKQAMTQLIDNKKKWIKEREAKNA